jgi:hypothetical protein
MDEVSDPDIPRQIGPVVFGRLSAWVTVRWAAAVGSSIRDGSAR